MEEKKQLTDCNEVYEIVEDNDLQLNLIEILQKIVRIRKKLFKTIVYSAIAALIFAFSIPKQYSVTVTLAPESSTAKPGGGLMGMAASFLGEGINSAGSDALNALMAPEIVSSTPFLLELLQANIVKEGDKITFSNYLDNESTAWWDYLLGFPSIVIGQVQSLFADGSVLASEEKDKGPLTLTKHEARQIKNLRSIISASVEKKTSLISLSLILQDPKVSAVVADSVVSKLQKYITNYRTMKAQEDCRYWEQLTRENREHYYEAQQRYAKFVDANANMIYQSTMVERERLQNEMSLAYQVYSQVEQQLQMAKAKVQEKKTIFTIIEPAVVPTQKANTSKLMILVTFVFVALMGVLAWEFFLKDFLLQCKKRWIEA